MRAENYPVRRHTDQRWRSAFENSGIGIAMADFSGRFFAANSAFLNIVGYTEPELYQLTFTDITYEEDREPNIRLLKDLREGKRQHFEIEKRYYRKHGSLVWVRTNVALVPGMGAGTVPFWFGIVEDITERKKAEKELLTLKDELSAELTAMTCLHEFSTRLLAIREFKPLLEEVLDATIALQNADFGSIQLYKPETRALEIVVQRGFQQDFLERCRTVRDIGTASGRAMELQERVIIEDVETDSELALHRRIAASAGFRAVQSTPLLSRTGEFLGVLSTYFRQPNRPLLRQLRFTDLYARHAADIIERERLQVSRRQVEEALQTAQADLARISRLTTMGELAASIAHEVNQPLTAITNNSSACLRLLADRNLGPDLLSRVLQEIVADGTRAAAVIAHIRSFLMKGPAEKNELDLNELIQEVLAIADRELTENRVLLERELTKTLPKVRGDRVQLQQVLLNLIVNGIEAMNELTTQPRILRVQSQMHEARNILVSVRDSGPGLGPDADRVFTPFFTTKAKGMGMGLPISRSLIEAHGGRLWVERNRPHGAVFHFTVPAAAGSSP